MDDVNNEKQPGKTLVAPSRRLEWSAPFHWLRQGWGDYRRARRISICYGLFFAVGGVILSLLVALYTSTIFLFSMGVLFVILGPLLAFGLYDIPRQLEQGETPTLRHSMWQIRHSAPNQWIFVVVMLVIALIWMRAATIIHVFYPQGAEPALEELVTFFAVGCSVGALFLGLVFGISAFSLPMMVDRRVDAISASLSSLNAVLNNTGVCILWGGLIFLLVLFGFATGFLGLILVLPLIGYATWHAYEDVMQSEPDG
ncbi:MAG: DUF2189 domain-containing protein [Pseudomonadota bacterium]|nr:hypothetical protein [Pseudomonadales bacterium]MDY6919663.1 DUF2189 domain-containing protein [Pseudomonadota bacterium]